MLSKGRYETPEVQVRVVKVSQATEVPVYKKIPKYNHVPLACINPSPKKTRPYTAREPQQINLETSPLKLQPQIKEKKELEPHLIRVPFDPNATPLKERTFVDTKGMTVAQKKQAKEAASKAAAEAVKVKKAKRTLYLLFAEIKLQLDSRESSEPLNERV
jgi:hypothetical protein